MVMESYRDAYRNMMDCYETCDPIAVAVALLGDEIVQETVCKPCYIETEGALTRGALIVDWFQRYPSEKRNPVRIVTKIDGHKLIDLMVESVLE